jgi:hypothetical protein
MVTHLNNLDSVILRRHDNRHEHGNGDEQNQRQHDNFLGDAVGHVLTELASSRLFHGFLLVAKHHLAVRRVTALGTEKLHQSSKTGTCGKRQ